MSPANIIFPPLEFKYPGVYHYTIKELNKAAPNWIIDRRNYRITVTVTDNGTGQLGAKVDYPDGPIQFCNVFYEPPTCQQCQMKGHGPEICEAFLCLPFPLFLFMPPQKPEFKKLMEIDPFLYERWNTPPFSGFDETE